MEDQPRPVDVDSNEKNEHAPDHQHDKNCADGCNEEKQKLPTIFDAIKSGMLVPFQTIVEVSGPHVLHTRDEKGHTPAHWACLGGHITILRSIIDLKGPVDDASDNELAQHPIHWACVNGHVNVIEVLLQHGVNIDTVDNKGCTPLIVACQYGKTVLAGYLMGKGSRLQLTDKDGDTALHWAAFKGQSELMRLLIYSGFNPHQRDSYGQTPLHLACISGNLTAVKELCEEDDVELDIADKNSKTPLLLAKGRKHVDIVTYLTKRAKRKRSFLPKFDIWAIVFGPPGNTKSPLLFFVVNMLFWAYPMYIIKCIPMTWEPLQSLHLIFLFLNVVMWICLYHASTTDPGYLPRNIPEYDQAIKEVAHFNDWQVGKNPLEKLCHTCRTVKPMRSKHCRICNRCVIMFDHHCPYIYNCVGEKNRVWFTGFVFSLSMNGLIGEYFSYYMLHNEGFDFLLVLSSVVLGLFVSIAFVVGSCTFFHASANLTTNERINADKYNYLKDGRGKYYNPFNRGIRSNLLEFLHLKRPMREDEVSFLNITVV